jgi:EAL domain-containing protein (putative c-di-GMP-specific phosphodiesterase class I)
MQQQVRLSLNAAAWFFVGQSASDGAHNNVPIKTPFRIGRKPDSDLYLPCTSVSGTHAEILEEDGGLWLYDLDSTNGTFVNGKRIQSRRMLTENDTVQFGTTVFQISRAMDSSLDDASSGSLENQPELLQSDRFERLFNGGVVPFFQPIYRIDETDQQAFGYEVLGRSRLYGLRTPAQMFAAASRLEMEAELSRVLRKQGIKVADKNLPKEHLLFVNTHPAELACEGLEDSLYDIRDNHPDRPIMLELHESNLNNPEKLVGLRTALQDLAIGLAFHDFGAGQIRMAELEELCPEVVKFDVKLTQGINQATSKRQQLIASLVKMVTGLGIKPLVECVEHSDEHETLKQLGFSLAQGFLYGRPCSISDVSRPRQSAVSEQFPMVKSFLDAPRNNAESNSIDDEPTSGTKDANWLLSQPPNQYTIQVLSAISRERAEQHIAMQRNPDQFAVFCKQGKTRMLHIVVYGVFADRAAAKAASAELANSSVSPWIRMISSVQAEIRSSQS